MKILITGGCGFVGHHVVEHFLKNSDAEIYVLDKLTYAACGFDRLRDVDAFDNRRVRIFTADLTRPISEGLIQEIKDAEVILHLAAESHVDRSIVDPAPFVYGNVLGTMHVLDMARRLDGLQAFNYFSTDEVFGPAPPGVAYREHDRFNPTNPYSATKAAGDCLVMAYANTYGLPAFVTQTMNCFGERQHPEKFIPLVIRKVLAGEPVMIHADETTTVSGSRFYIHCRNVASALDFLIHRFTPRDKYNIVGEQEVSNLDLARMIAGQIGKPLEYELVDFHSSRPGHDLRYALDGAKLAEMGWKPPRGFEASLARTVTWTMDHREKWLW